MSKLWYKRWAQEWNEALPIGNGRIGAMVFGDPRREEIYLNEETLWSGSPEDAGIQYGMDRLEEIRTHIKKKEFDRSDAKLSAMMEGRTTQLYLTAGLLKLSTRDFEGTELLDYRRELDLDTAVIGVNAVYRDKRHGIVSSVRQEYFTSLADDVMAVSVKTDSDRFAASVALDLWLPCDKFVCSGDTIRAEGRCYTDFKEDAVENQLVLEPGKESVPYCIIVRVLTDGEVCGQGRQLYVRRASGYTLIYSIATGFNGYDRQPITEGRPYREICAEKLENALQYSFEELKQRHMEAYGKQYDRVELCIDGEDYGHIPTDERIRNAAGGTVDNKLTETLFDYGRYLLISSSQEGGQPANLQGIWTKEMASPWRSNYTLNINTQMNYWAAEQVDLPQCHMPLLRMVKELAGRGNHYGLRGWCCSHNTDLWRFNAEATKGVCWGYWHMGGVWMARHIYEHYMFTRDTAFLEEYFGVLEGIHDFLSDWMIRDEKGRLTTCPSTSPENHFSYRGIKAAAAEGSAMDLSVIADYLENMVELSSALQRDGRKYEKMLSELKPLKIGSDGRLLEYGEEFEEPEKGHRHISHLYGVYPAKTIGEGSPFFEAAKKSLEYRLENGGGHTGWSNAWIANVYARFRDGERANSHIINMFQKSIYPNMLDAHPPFQIDGNFGICAAICEMLLQSHGGETVFLPAIPDAWKSGCVKGMKTREGKKVSFRWENDKVFDIVYE